MPVSDASIQALSELIPPGDWVDALDDADYQERRRRALADLTTPDFEIAMIGPGGFTGTFSGQDALTTAWSDWLEPFESYSVEREPEFRRSDDVVVFFGRQVVTLKGSERPISNDGAMVAFFAGDKLKRLEFHLDRASALRSAGL